jgi:small-conductance mechanosensitive channel
MDATKPYLDGMSAFLSHHQALEGFIILVASLIAGLAIRLLTFRKYDRDTCVFGIVIDGEILRLIRSVFWQTIVIVGGLSAIPHLLQQRLPETRFIISKLLQSYLVSIWALGVIRFLRTLARKHSFNERERHAYQLIENIGIIVITVNATLLILHAWHVDITPLLASAGIAGVIAGLASQSVLSNVFSGLHLLIDRPFKPGDYVILSSGERGEVVEIGLRSTNVLTRDDLLVSVPNAVLANSKIINESAPQTRSRVRIKVGIAYGSDIDQVEEILLHVAEREKDVESEPTPRVRFRSFGDSSLEFELLCWIVRPADRGLVTHHLNRAVYKEFNKAGIVIPVPQRDVYFHNVTDSKEP